jgi:hypothetical protein
MCSGSATDQDDSDDMLDDDVFATTPVALVRTGSERYFPEFAYVPLTAYQCLPVVTLLIGCAHNPRVFRSDDSRRRKKTAGSFESLHAAAGQERFVCD